jgi:hypothetical protein
MRNNDSGAAGIITLIFVFLLAAVLFAIMSYGIDKLTFLSIHTMTVNASQMRYDTLNIQLILFRLEPMILLIGAGINYWVTQARQSSGITDLGGMLMSAGEMIIGTFVLMIIGFFGGAAIEQVIGVMELWAFTPPEDTYFIIQYLNVVFYGMITLMIVSLIALFIVKCVQIVDYASTPGYM